MIIESFLQYDYFENINLDDPFFDSLKKDYIEFEQWFNKKSKNKAFYFKDDNGDIQAFLYLKTEEEALDDIEPAFPLKKRIKIGTLKINPHGTRLGERFIKKAFDFAITNNIFELYVTIYEKHEGLLNLLKKYGFETKAIKKTANGNELVLFKVIDHANYVNPFESYPLVNRPSTTPYLLSIIPEYHTKLFPDSILNNETYDLIQDVSHTNSIEKTYICKMPGVQALRPGDPIVIYRTNDYQGPAEYRSVATSLCVVTQVKKKRDFSNLDEYIKFCGNNTVFADNNLRKFYNWDNFFVIKLTYNLAFNKKVIRRQLADTCGLDRDDYWGIMRLEHHQFECIMQEGEVNESFIIY